MDRDNCIFCKIVKGDMSSATVYENDEFKIILDRFPSSLGHVLIITKEHIQNIFEMPYDKAARMFELTVKMANVVKNQLKCDGINILQNNNEAAGQSVPHFHIHIIPRYADDKMNIPWKTIEPTDSQMEDCRKKLADGIDF